MKRYLIIFAAVILLAFMAQPAQALKVIVATIAGGQVQVAGIEAGKNKPIYWEGTQVTTTNKFGLFQFSTTNLPIDCVGQLQSGTGTPINVVINGCTTEQVVGGGVPKTGQTTSYTAGDDGALQKGVAWPIPRFTDNGNGTVTDNLTKLIWLKNANCTDTVGGINKINGYLLWADALTWSNNLAAPACGLSDGSVAGNWRLPNVRELQSLVDYGYDNPAISNSAGTGQGTPGDPFDNLQLQASNYWPSYWSSTTYAGLSGNAWYVRFFDGFVSYGYGVANYFYVLAVRGGS